jgi:phosphoenolpyruvate-protein phosphotransferase
MSDLSRALKGLAAAPGTVVGPALRYVAPDPSELRRVDDQAAEQQRLKAGIAQADRAIAAIEAGLRAEGKDEEAEIFAAHRMLLDDPMFQGVAEEFIAATDSPAEAAIVLAAEHQAIELEALNDPYLSARAADLRDVAAQVRRALTGEQSLGERFAAPAVVLAEDLGPSDLMSVPRARLLGFALAAGGLTAHVAILARGLGIPAVVGIGPTLLAASPPTTVALDGTSGVVTLDPTPELVAQIEAAQHAQAAREATWRAETSLPASTADGHAVALLANASTADEAAVAQGWGAMGVGLLRTELLFLDRAFLPSEMQQLELYSAVAQALPGQPITVRTLDVGGDKQLPAFPLPAEANPFLGWRGLRIGLSRPDILLPQLRALLRAAEVAPIKIMLPMVSTLAELRQARALLEQARAALVEAGVAHGKPQLGIMIEVPAAALNATALAREADFFSIGTNDLTQYTLACDRGNSRVAELYQPLDPAVLRLIQMTCAAARATGREVSVCGELAGDPQASALLIGLGVTGLSCAPPALPRIRAAIRATNAAAAAQLAQRALAAESADEVRALLEGAA